MTCPYDTLMDRLAELAVQAVQDPGAAVQAYWLVLASETPVHTPAPLLTCGTLLQRALAAPPVDTWAQGHLLAALAQVLQDGIFLQGRVALPRRGVVAWEAFAPYRDVVLQVPCAYQPYMAEIRSDAERLWEAACWLYGTAPATCLTISLEVLRGAVLFEAGFYFACHEYFETLWGRTEDVASDFYQGLIQVAVAMCHLQSHNLRGALKLLHTGMARLQLYPDVYQGVDLATFLRELATLRQRLRALPCPTTYRFDVAQVPRLLRGSELRSHILPLYGAS